jgi:hypothetical protein
METITEVLNKFVNMRTGSTKEEIMSDLASLERLISELRRPEFRYCGSFGSELAARLNLIWNKDTV